MNKLFCLYLAFLVTNLNAQQAFIGSSEQEGEVLAINYNTLNLITKIQIPRKNWVATNLAATPDGQTLFIQATPKGVSVNSVIYKLNAQTHEIQDSLEINGKEQDIYVLDQNSLICGNNQVIYKVNASTMSKDDSITTPKGRVIALDSNQVLITDPNDNIFKYDFTQNQVVDSLVGYVGYYDINDSKTKMATTGFSSNKFKIYNLKPLSHDTTITLSNAGGVGHISYSQNGEELYIGGEINITMSLTIMNTANWTVEKTISEFSAEMFRLPNDKIWKTGGTIAIFNTISNTLDTTISTQFPPFNFYGAKEIVTSSLPHIINLEGYRVSDYNSPYPIPTSGKLYLDHRFSKVGIYNLKGKLVKTQKLSQNSSVSLSELQKGIYILAAETPDGKRARQKVVVQ